MGYALREVQIAALHSSWNLQVIGVLRDQSAVVNPPIDFTLAASDQLIFLADTKNHFQAFQQFFIQLQSQQQSKHHPSI
jgi:K+/H+ antiporter YhaU regulatory subunit KhtT